MKKKRVLFLIHALGSGGAERILINIIKNIDKELFDITVMTVLDTGPLVDEIPEHITYKSIFKRKKKKVLTTKEAETSVLTKKSGVWIYIREIYSLLWKIMPCKLLYKLTIREKYDIEVSFLEGIPAKIISASNNSFSKKICWIHVDLINEKKSDKFFISRKNQKKVYDKFDHVACVSKNVKNSFDQKYKIDETKSIVIYNPVDCENILKLANENTQMPYKENVFNICTIGRLCEQKGYDRLINVASLLKDDYKKFCIYIIGEGPDEVKLKEMIIENDLQDNVIMLGFKKNPYPYLKNADMYVCSSRAEGYSTVATEALILQVPSLVTNCSGMNEIYNYGKYGVIVNNDEKSLYSGIRNILQDELQYKNLIENTVSGKDFYDLQKLIGVIEDLFLTNLKSSKSVYVNKI